MSGGVPHKSNLLFLQWTNLKNEPIAKEKILGIKGPSRSGWFHGKIKCLTLWPRYIGEKGRTLGKTYGIKARFYSEHPWETHWEAYPPVCSPGFICFLYTLSSFVLCGGYVYLLLVACMPALVPQNPLGLTRSNFLTHLTWIVQPHEYIKRFVDLDHSAFNLPRDLEE